MVSRVNCNSGESSSFVDALIDSYEQEVSGIYDELDQKVCSALLASSDPQTLAAASQFSSLMGSIESGGGAVLARFKKGINSGCLDRAGVSRLINQLESGKRALKLRTKLVLRKVDKEIKLFSSSISSLSVAKRVQEIRQIALEDVTDEMIEEFAEKEARAKSERAFLELCQEEEREASLLKAVSKKKRKKKKKKKTIQVEDRVRTPPARLDVLASRDSSINAELRKKIQYCNQLYKRPSYKEHPRVTKRWVSRDLSKLRQIKDYDKEGNPVYRYAKCAERELLRLRAFHYLPGTEKVVFEDRDRKTYTFPTKRGVGMMCRVTLGGEMVYGVLYLGMNEKERIVYHRFFEPKTFDKGIQEIFQRIFPPSLGDAKISEEEDGWEFQGRYSFSLLDEEVLEITYPEEDHSICIYPIKG